MIKLAFTGKAQSGKTTCANYLEEMYGLATLSFADELKQNLISIGVSIDSLVSDKTELSRTLMQVYGEQMREQDIDYWVKELAKTIEAVEFDEMHDGIAIDDLRFLNEAEYLRNNRFAIVRVERSGDNFGLVGSAAAHVSETEQEDIIPDYTVVAESVEELYGSMDSLMGELERGLYE